MERVDIYGQISRNKRNSILLGIAVFAILSTLVFSISQIFAPEYALVILSLSFVLIIVDIAFSYNYGDKVVLKSVNAKPAGETKHRHLIDTVEGLAIAAGMPRPNVYVMESDEINAFACGKDPAHSSICITSGALQKLKRDEIEGVIGHEMSHIKNYDIRFSTLIAVLVGLAAIVSWMFLRSSFYGGLRSNDRKDGGYVVILLIIAVVLAIVAPIVTRLVQAAVSRKREFLADASGAQLTRYPDGLANALEKIKSNHGNMKVSDAVSHLFISDPSKSHLDSLFASHPPLDERIKILRGM